jgi:transporter family protein
MTADLQTGMAYALAAGTLWGIGPLLLKRGLARSNVSTATLIEQVVAVLFLVVLTVAQGQLAFAEVSGRAFWSFAAAGMIGASFGKIFYIKGIDKVGASKATSVKNSSPILTTILAVVFLGEQLTWPIAVGVIAIVIGIGVLSRAEIKGDGRPSRIVYFWYPLLAAVCFGINPVFKKMGVDASGVPVLGALITQGTGLLVMLTAGRYLQIKPQWAPVPAMSFFLFALAGIFEAVGSLFTYHALVHAPAVLVSPIWRISPLVTFLLVHFTLKGIEVVTLRDGMAASLIVAGIFVLGWV